ncbi:hypothetical protein K2173_024664 [Erythroxylum novogranatense]|uniref:2Fe-2S ferredoxin-type domain-containing protein n=1 Tax=Erythroxylum novogranatense TaxID=1862640 RepID=A0AAV8SUZ3_9ROSI|nr:hypothetical protein K2173_024664 [Erythroxylum novogranatense]
MGTLQLNSHVLPSFQHPRTFTHSIYTNKTTLKSRTHVSFSRHMTKAISTVPESTSDSTEPEEPPAVHIAFVHSVLLPDGTPDLHFRKACGGQKLRDIMLDTNVELYGPYGRPLCNCAGGGTCGTCMVEVLEGKHLLNPRTENEKEKLKKKPKNWRLACQTTVGTPESKGLLVIQQLPEWKVHEWKYKKVPPSEFFNF